MHYKMHMYKFNVHTMTRGNLVTRIVTLLPLVNLINEIKKIKWHMTVVPFSDSDYSSSDIMKTQCQFFIYNTSSQELQHFNSIAHEFSIIASNSAPLMLHGWSTDDVIT